jgi:hypothetical protein
VVKPVKPKASRDKSSETFLVGIGLKEGARGCVEISLGRARSKTAQMPWMTLQGAPGGIDLLCWVETPKIATYLSA